MSVCKGVCIIHIHICILFIHFAQCRAVEQPRLCVRVVTRHEPATEATVTRRGIVQSGKKSLRHLRACVTAPVEPMAQTCTCCARMHKLCIAYRMYRHVDVGTSSPQVFPKGEIDQRHLTNKRSGMPPPEAVPAMGNTSQYLSASGGSPPPMNN